MILSLADIQRLIAEEEQSAEECLHLTANETLLSPFAQSALSSNLANRYLLEHIDMREGSPSRLGNFLYRGLNNINVIERSAGAICKEIFHATYAEFRCLSGLHAMQTTFLALTRPGDKVMRVSTKDGGHFLTELLCRSLGRSSCTYVFKNGEIDLDSTREVFNRERPKLLYIDAMNYLFPIQLGGLKSIVEDTPIVFDASHTLGLIAGGQFQSPLSEGADILQANTHKTFFGPQKGIILGNDASLMDRISYVLSNALVSSQHTASLLALMIALHETYNHGRLYASRVIENARYLAGAAQRRGLEVLASDKGFTNNHMFFIDARPYGSGPILIQRLLAANISVNRLIAFEHVDALRLGVQEITRRGYDWEDLEQIADWLARLLIKGEDTECVKQEVLKLVAVRRGVKYQSADDKQKPSGEGVVPLDLRKGGSLAQRPRWINSRLLREHLVMNATVLERVRELGHLAGAFEHQTDIAGNISCFVGDRFYVTATGAHIGDLLEGDFVEILGLSDGVLKCRGNGPPSSESFMHYLVRRNVGAKFIVHNHFIPQRELRLSNLTTIPPKEYGSIALAESVAEAARQNNTIYIRKHGLVFWGHTFAECRGLVGQFADAAVSGQAARGVEPAERWQKGDSGKS